MVENQLGITQGFDLMNTLKNLPFIAPIWYVTSSHCSNEKKT